MSVEVPHVFTEFDQIKLSCPYESIRGTKRTDPQLNGVPHSRGETTDTVFKINSIPLKGFHLAILTRPFKRIKTPSHRSGNQRVGLNNNSQLNT